MERAQAMVFGSFIGDSLSLGVHWIYNVKAIEKRVGRIDDLIAPVVKTFHPRRGAGDLTHYGDQMLLLLEFCAGQAGEAGQAGDRAGEAGHGDGTGGKPFDQSAFLYTWAEYMKGYDGYMDHASEDTLAAWEQLSEEERGQAGDRAGSGSDDLAGASRIAPVIYFYREDTEQAAAAARAQAAVTHNEASVLEAAGFFAELSLQVLSGAEPVQTARDLAASLCSGGTLEELVNRGLDSADRDTTEAIAEFGQACSVEKGLPSVMHLIARYEDDLKEALVASTMAGGDSAARNHAVGMVLGAHLGADGLPQKWFDQLSARSRIEGLL